MYCRKCGTRIRQGLEFCPKCGAKQLGNEQSRPQEAEEQRRQEEQRRHEEEQRRRASAQTQPDTVPQPIPQAPATAAAPATTADGTGGKAGPNKSLLFVVVVIALLVGFAIYTNGQKSGGDRSDVPVSKSDAPAGESNDRGSSSDDTSATAEKGPDGYWWLEATGDDGITIGVFLVVDGSDVTYGLVRYEGSADNVVDWAVTPGSEDNYEYNAKSDGMTFKMEGSDDLTLKRATDAQRKLIDETIARGAKPREESSGSSSTNDTSSEKGPDGYWWVEAVQVEDGVQTDAFMIVNGDDVQLGVVKLDESEVKGANVMPVEDASIEYDSSSDELVAHDIAAYDMRFKRANEWQRKIADAIVAEVGTEGSGD